MMFVVLSEIHSSFGHMKKVKQASMEFSMHLTAEGVSTVGCRTGGIADTRKLLAQREVVRARRKNGLPAVTWLWLAVYIRSLIRVGWRKVRGE